MGHLVIGSRPTFIWSQIRSFSYHYYYYFFFFSVRVKGEHEGRIFDERDVSFCLGEGIESDIPPGVEKGLEKFIKGETSRLELKPQYGFGAIGHERFGIPPNAHLSYTVTLKDFDPVRYLT